MTGLISILIAYLYFVVGWLFRRSLIRTSPAIRRDLIAATAIVFFWPAVWILEWMQREREGV